MYVCMYVCVYIYIYIYIYIHEDFSNVGAGWSRLEVTKCAGVSMLGGYCKFAKGEVKKTFTDLPPHRILLIIIILLLLLLLLV